MKVKVIKLFKDKFDNKTLYQVGEVHSFEKKRAQDLIKRGLAEQVKPQTTDPIKETTEEKDPKVGEPEEVAKK